MNKQILTLILGMFLLTTISALYAGESITIDIGQTYEYYSIVGNSSEVVLEITQDGTWITITPDKYSVDDNYEVVFFDKEKETIIEYRSSGGGSSRTIYKDKNITQYVDKVVEKEKIVEKQVPGETKTITEYVEKIDIELKALTMILVCIILLLLIWNVVSSIKRRDENNSDEYYSYTAEKEVKQDE